MDTRAYIGWKLGWTLDLCGLIAMCTLNRVYTPVIPPIQLGDWTFVFENIISLSRSYSRDRNCLMLRPNIYTRRIHCDKKLIWQKISNYMSPVSSYSELLGMLPDDMPPELSTFLGCFQSAWIFGNPLRHNSTARYPPQT